MDRSKEIREIINLNEISVLEKLTNELRQAILQAFECETLSENGFPYRYKFVHKDFEYEFIFSSMGAFTIRPIPNVKQSRTFPIFYLSIGKYPAGFFWENINQETIALDAMNLRLEILKAIENYENSF